MARFLDQQWLEQATALLDASEEVRRAAAGPGLTVQHVVVDREGADHAYHLCLSSGSARLEPGHASGPDVTFTLSYDTAAALNRGGLTAGDAFARGLVKVKGDLGVVVARGDALAAVDDVLAPLRATTDY